MPSITGPTQVAPDGLVTGEFVLRPITADDAPADYAAVMETRHELRLWQQSSWPADDFTVEGNREDLAGMEQRHRERKAFSYSVVDPAGTECLGCVYLFPIDATFLAKSSVTPVGDAAWADVEAVAYFWARRLRMATGMDGRLLAALRTWLREAWRLDRVVFVTNEQFGQQADLLRGTDLALQFELREPGKAGTYLVFG